MARGKHTRESIITELQETARRLDQRSLTKGEVAKHVSASLSSIRYRFGTLGDALEAAGLERHAPGWNLPRGPRITEEELLSALADVEDAVGRPPGHNDVNAHGKHSTTPYRKRWGNWAAVLRRYEAWKQETEHVQGADTAPSRGHPPAPRDPQPPVAPAPHPQPVSVPQAAQRPTQYFGEPIQFRGLQHAPTNEQGVVLLFGMVCQELGFRVEAVQQGFPECIAKYCDDPKTNRWAAARIEFEFRASAFHDHGHSAEGCDFIVCWENDWCDCPLSVIELKSEIQKLSSR